MQKLKTYLTLDTKFSDVVNSDGTKHTWYLDNLTTRRLKNVTNVSIYSFSMSYIISNIIRNRITIRVDEFIESFKHLNREFQFLGETKIVNGILGGINARYVRYNFPYNEGRFVFNKPVKELSSVTLSVADPFEPIPITDVYKLSSTITQPFTVFVIRSNDIDSETFKALNSNRYRIVGLTSNNPADNALISYLTRPEGFSVSQSAGISPYVSLSIDNKGFTLLGTLSTCTVEVLLGHLLINLEICHEVQDNKMIVNNIGSSLVRLNIKHEALFQQVKKTYVSLDTSLAIQSKLNVLEWGLQDFSQRLDRMASVSSPIRKILGIKCSPLVRGFSASDDDFYRYDVYLIYIREFGNQCFLNKTNNVRYNFVLSRDFRGPSSILGVERYELSAENCNKGWYHFNKPIDNLSSITLESYQRYFDFRSSTSFRPVSILSRTLQLDALSGGANLTITTSSLATVSDINIGDIVIINGFTDDNLSVELVDLVNYPVGYEILNIVGNVYTLNVAIPIGVYNYLGSTDTRPVAIFPSKPTVITMELALQK